MRQPHVPDTAFRPVFGTAATEASPPDVADAGDGSVDEAAVRAALLEDARTEGYAAGLAAGRRAAEEAGQERVAAALDGLAGALTQAREEAVAAAQEAARDLAGLVLAMLDTALPGLTAERAQDLLRRLAEELLPRLKLLPAPRFVVAPGLAPALTPVLRGLDITVTEDEAVPVGDARIEWGAGLLRFDRSARMTALRDAMAEAGIAWKE